MPVQHGTHKRNGSKSTLTDNTCYLLNLPIEIFTQIIRDVERDNQGSSTLRRLAQTNHVLLDYFTPQLYHTLVLRPDLKSGRSVQRITTGLRARYVRCIIFRTRDTRPAWEHRTLTSSLEQQHDSSAHRLSIPTKQVLLSLHRFPNLLQVQFTAEFKLDLLFSSDPEPRLYPVSGSSETHRSILDEALRALGRSVHRNNARALPKLSIRGLPARKYKALSDHSLHALFNDLKAFHIEFPDQLIKPTPPSYCTYLSTLNETFLNHLANVRTLYIQFPAGTVLGESHGTPSINFRGVRLRCLKRVTLENYIIGQDVDKFILLHLSSLSTVVLKQCLRDMSWDSLFRRAVAMKPVKLTSFDVSLSQATLHQDSTLGDDSGDYLFGEDQASEGIEDSDASKLMFPRVKTFCGHIWESPEDELLELAEGRTVAAWNRLQDVVRANRLCWERFSQGTLLHRGQIGTVEG